MNDGIVYEKGSDRQLRAVVMRHGMLVRSKWYRTKESALRNLVLRLVTSWSATDTAFHAVADDREREQRLEAEDHRPIVADILDALAGEMIGDKSEAIMAHVNGNEVIEMNYVPLYRGAATLRWVARREAR
jgi:hypothetical protein